VRPDIRTVGDLKGKRLGVTRFGTASDFGMRLMISKLNLNPDKDVSILQIGDNPTKLIALQATSIDGAIFDPPEYKKAVESGGRVLVNLEETVIPYQHAGLMTTRKLTASRTDMVRRVGKSIIEGAALVRKERQSALWRSACASKMKRNWKRLTSSCALHPSKAISQCRRLSSHSRRPV
jgi:NitT/TauT family transport system substrate-binding protein